MHYALRSKLIIISFILAVSLPTFSQKSYPKGYFASPVSLRLLLSGNFGELRDNHFHSGIDIKTDGAEGKEVYAVADGYVSRIKISPWGFGKAVYVTHPNGYVSLYGHLSRYNQKIGDYVRQQQFAQESFEIEVFPAAGELPVKKGELIAYSGNTGGSGGPHLHFELRDGASQKPINPLLFGFDVKDIFKPRITSIKIYTEDDNARINGANKDVRYLVEGWGTEHKLANSPAIKLSGKISFAIQTYDQQNDTDNKNGPYAISLFIDSKEVYHIQMETFSFDDTRYVNSLIDYEEYKRNDCRLERTKIDPGNKIDIYSDVLNKGVYLFDDTLTHTIRYEVTDVPGNLASLTFRVKGEKQNNSKLQVPNSKIEAAPAKFPISNFKWDAPNHYENRLVIVDAPAGVFYDSFTFKFDTAKRVINTYSPVYKIHNKYTPVQDYITISLKPFRLSGNLDDKALAVKINDDGKTFTSAGGKYDERTGFVVTKVRELGDYAVAVDTISPVIKPVQPEVFTKMAGQKKIKLKVTDNLAGIAGYRGSLNGKWIILEYDPKNDMLIYDIDDRLVPGKNTLLVEVTDGKNNKSFFAATLIL